MRIQSVKDACTGTWPAKFGTGIDEILAYIEITERLIAAKPPAMTIARRVVREEKKWKLPMRASFFAEVPAYISFRRVKEKNSRPMPREIARHLIWWRGKNQFQGAIGSTALESGFTASHDLSSDWIGSWSNRRQYSRVRGKAFRKIDRFPGDSQLGNKASLWLNYRRMRERHGARYFDYMPRGFLLPAERYVFKRHMNKHGGTWILKPPHSCAGQGIQIVSRWCQVPCDRDAIAQVYVSRPMLIRGLKFDLRLYVLLTSLNPLRIYLYEDGLVRFATVEYVYHPRTFEDNFMHLTNTSVNKRSPKFRCTDRPDQPDGSTWSLRCFWRYLESLDRCDTTRVRNEIKDIAVKTIISAEARLVEAWRKSFSTAYNFNQLFGFDVLLDEYCRPWLLEVNDFPSMDTVTPVCKIVKASLAVDYLNLVGFHVPNVLTREELRAIERTYGETTRVCYDHRLYKGSLTREDRRKQCAFSKVASREDYIDKIHERLTAGDARVLIRHEDEIARTGSFERIFPTRYTYEYFRLFENKRYYNLLLDAWENRYASDRPAGRRKIAKFCSRIFRFEFSKKCK